LFSLPIVAQVPDWQHVDVNIRKLNPSLAPVRLTPAHKRKIARFISRHLMPDSDECVSLPEMPGPTFSIAPVGASSIYVVRSGRGCGGGSGNAPAWLIDARGEEPRMLADIYGWGLGVQQHVSHGLHDFVTGWSMGADEFGLSYYRYDGATYRKVGHREVISCDSTGRTLNSSCYKEGGRPLDTTPPEQ
jgi:hypothetical protein